MFDAIPVHVWLVAVIAATAFRPAQYVYLYIVHSPSRRDITQPPEDLSWRTPGELAYHGAILVLLLAVAVFIFTPTAERLARSERFLPLLAALFGSWAAFTAVRGFTTGRIQPLMRGIAKTYRRRKHPIRYWASVAWNAALGCSLMWLAYGINEDATAQEFADRCAQRAEGELVLRQLAACDELVRLRPDDAESYLDRGVIFLELGGLDSAIADFNRAHQLDPEDPWPLANRGVARAWKKDQAGAEKDFAVVRLTDPSNPVMLRGEAILRMNARDLDGAVESLTASMARDPDNLWALRTRSELYWELGEHEKSAIDDRRWVELSEKSRARPE